LWDVGYDRGKVGKELWRRGLIASFLIKVHYFSSYQEKKYPERKDEGNGTGNSSRKGAGSGRKLRERGRRGEKVKGA